MDDKKITMWMDRKFEKKKNKNELGRPWETCTAENKTKPCERTKLRSILAWIRILSYIQVRRIYVYNARAVFRYETFWEKIYVALSLLFGKIYLIMN
jgi:hypothetical protein